MPGRYDRVLKVVSIILEIGALSISIRSDLKPTNISKIFHVKILFKKSPRSNSTRQRVSSHRVTVREPKDNHLVGKFFNVTEPDACYCLLIWSETN